LEIKAYPITWFEFAPSNSFQAFFKGRIIPQILIKCLVTILEVRGGE